MCIATATTLIHLFSFDCTKIDILPCAGHYVCKYQRKVRLWSCAPGVELQPASCMMGLKAVSQQDEGMDVRKVPFLGLGFLRAAQYPGNLVALAIRCWNSGRGLQGPTRADRLRSQPAAIRGGRTSTGGSTVTQTSAHSQRVKLQPQSCSLSLHTIHNSISVVTPYMWLLVTPPKVISLLL